MLEVPPKYQYGPEALEQLYVSSSSGQQVPLRTLITSAVKVSPLVVNHQGQFPSVTISYNLLPGTSLGEAVASIQQVEKGLGKPLSLTTSFQGNGQAFAILLSSTPILILAALVVIYLILGILYESIIHPVTIISTLPSAGVGALLLLMAAHLRSERDRDDRHPLADRHRQEERHHAGRLCYQVEHSEGLTAEDSIKGLHAALSADPDDDDGGAARCRAADAGYGVGSEMRQPLGFAIVGGLALSQVLTLYTTPVIYIYFDELQTWMFRGRRSSRLPCIPSRSPRNDR